MIGNYYHEFFTERQRLLPKKVEVRQLDAQIQSFVAVKTHMVLIIVVPVMQLPPPKEQHKDANNRLRKQ